MVLPCDLIVVYEAMGEPPVEPLESLNLRFLSYKTALMLVLASAKHVGDLHVLSVHPSYIQFGSRVVLRLNAVYTPKVMSGEYSVYSFKLPALSNLSIDSEDIDRRLQETLCEFYGVTSSRRRLCVLLTSFL